MKLIECMGVNIDICCCYDWIIILLSVDTADMYVNHYIHGNENFDLFFLGCMHADDVCKHICIGLRCLFFVIAQI